MGKIIFFPNGIDMLFLDYLFWWNRFTLSPSIERSSGIDETPRKYGNIIVLSKGNINMFDLC